MGTITHLLDISITILRLSEVATDRMAMSTVTSAFGHIQPQVNDKRGLETGVFGKQFKIYVDGGLDAQAGDRIRDSNGITYNVVAGGDTRRTFSAIDYKILLVEKIK